MWISNTLDIEEQKVQGPFKEIDNSNNDFFYVGEVVSQGKSVIFHGKGILVNIIDKYIYEGYFNYGEFDKLGLLVCDNKTVYKGSFPRDRYGEFVFSDGAKYTGEC